MKVKLNWNKFENLEGRKISVVFYPKNRLAVETPRGALTTITESLTEAKAMCERHCAEKMNPEHTALKIQDARAEQFSKRNMNSEEYRAL